MDESSPPQGETAPPPARPTYEELEHDRERLLAAARLSTNQMADLLRQVHEAERNLQAVKADLYAKKQALQAAETENAESRHEVQRLQAELNQLRERLAPATQNPPAPPPLLNTPKPPASASHHTLRISTKETEPEKTSQLDTLSGMLAGPTQAESVRSGSSPQPVPGTSTPKRSRNVSGALKALLNALPHHGNSRKER